MPMKSRKDHRTNMSKVSLWNSKIVGIVTAGLKPVPNITKKRRIHLCFADDTTRLEVEAMRPFIPESSCKHKIQREIWKYVKAFIGFQVVSFF